MPKLIDYEERVDDLWASENLFGPVTAVSLAVLRKQGPGWKQDDHGRYAFKHMLMKRLVGQRRDRDKIRTLLWFLDWLVSLPEPLKIQYVSDICSEFEEETMRFRSSLEEVAEMEGKKRGLEEGRLMDKQDVLVRLVRRRFRLNEEVQHMIQTTENPDALDAAIDAVIDASSVDEILKPLQQATNS